MGAEKTRQPFVYLAITCFGYHYTIEPIPLPILRVVSSIVDRGVLEQHAEAFDTCLVSRGPVAVPQLPGRDTNRLIFERA